MTPKISLCIFVLSVLSLQTVKASSWHYNSSGSNGPDIWFWSYEDCNGTSQSPINIVTSDAVEDGDLEDFGFSNYDTTSGISMVIENNGHTAKISLEGATILIGNGGLPENYVFAQLHFHWGSSDSTGSEHTVDGVQYPMEVHLAHYAESQGSLAAAVDQVEGLAVLGFFFEISDDDNDDLDEIITALDDIDTIGSNTTVTTFELRQLIGSSLGSYYRYSGSLTTPGCQESVIWSVFEETIPISSSQMATFRTLYNDWGAYIEDNYRPVQSLNARTVSYYDDDDDAAVSHVTSLLAVVTVAVLATVC